MEKDPTPFARRMESIEGSATPRWQKRFRFSLVQNTKALSASSTVGSSFAFIMSGTVQFPDPSRGRHAPCWARPPTLRNQLQLKRRTKEWFEQSPRIDNWDRNARN